MKAPERRSDPHTLVNVRQTDRDLRMSRASVPTQRFVFLSLSFTLDRGKPNMSLQTEVHLEAHGMSTLTEQQTSAGQTERPARSKYNVRTFYRKVRSLCLHKKRGNFSRLLQTDPFLHWLCGMPSWCRRL